MRACTSEEEDSPDADLASAWLGAHASAQSSDGAPSTPRDLTSPALTAAAALSCTATALTATVTTPLATTPSPRVTPPPSPPTSLPPPPPPPYSPPPPWPRHCRRRVRQQRRRRGPVLLGADRGRCLSYHPRLGYHPASGGPAHHGALFTPRPTLVTYRAPLHLGRLPSPSPSPPHPSSPAPPHPPPPPLPFPRRMSCSPRAR